MNLDQLHQESHRFASHHRRPQNSAGAKWKFEAPMDWKYIGLRYVKTIKHIKRYLKTGFHVAMWALSLAESGRTQLQDARARHQVVQERCNVLASNLAEEHAEFNAKHFQVASRLGQQGIGRYRPLLVTSKSQPFQCCCCWVF